MTDAPQDHWSVDKRLPVATLFALLLQTGVIIWWAATLDAKVSQQQFDLNEFRAAGPGTRDRVIVLETLAAGNKETLKRLDEHLEKIDSKLDQIIKDRK